jgi:hypothetical protein
MSEYSVCSLAVAISAQSLGNATAICRVPTAGWHLLAHAQLDTYMSEKFFFKIK